MCVGLGSAVQHQAATAVEGYRGAISLLWRLAHSGRWMAGLVATGTGVLLHAAALHSGAVVVVEAVLVANLALALPARALLDRIRPSAGLVLAAVVLSGAVALFVAAAHPSSGQSAPDAGAAFAAIAAGATVAGLCWAASIRARSGRIAGFALGLAAGTLYGLVGGVLKATVHTLLQDGVLAVIAGWPLWALVVLGAWGFALHQRAYTRAPLQASLPALSVASPLVGMAFGILAFREVPASGTLAVLGEVAGMAAIVVSVAVLGRLSTTPARQPGRHSQQVSG